MCDQSRSSRFQAAFESALQDYETQTGITLVTHPFTEQFEKCLSVASITSVLQDHAKALGYFRGRKKIMRSIERTAFYLCMCPTFVALGDSIGSVRLKILVMVFRSSDAYSTAIPTCESHLYWPHCPTRCISIL